MNPPWRRHLSNLTDTKGEPSKWVDRDGYMESVKGAGYVRTKQEFGSVQLHVGFATPANVVATGQERGNSGVFVQGKCEVQVLARSAQRQRVRAAPRQGAVDVPGPQQPREVSQRVGPRAAGLKLVAWYHLARSGDTMTRRTRLRLPSGRFLLRLDPALHAALKTAAAAASLSLNDYCARKLALPLDPVALAPGGHEVVCRAVELYGDALAGVVVFGSWARGDAASGSDVDVLVVLDRRLPLTRALYAGWDASPVTWDQRPVEVHLAHLPEPGEPASSLWGEVAIDGVVVYEQPRRVSACLAGVRREVAAGRLVRNVVQGQPYWTRVA